MKKGIRSLKKREALLAWVYLLPVLMGITFCVFIPVIAALVISFTEWTGLKPPTFTGFQNYINIFTKDYFFYKSVLVTLYYALGAVILGIVYSFMLAMLLNRKIPIRGFWRSVYYLPCVIPGMAVAILWGWMYNVDFGLFNLILRMLGIPRSMWIFGERTAIPSMWLMGIWTSGNLVIIFLAGLQNVPQVYHEAAEIDGANAFRRFIHITIPMMTPIIFYNFLMSVIGSMQAFTQAFVLTSGGPNNATLFTVFLIYREGFRNNNFGYAGAISFVFFIIIGLITALIFKTSNGLIFYEGK
ncbi:MAG: sugar ABC transporter permease [Treponema sp.]|jgi:multiple sugar transport system permease protein|nr:sugar ABC transporter permease [Treponema sp.]